MKFSKELISHPVSTLQSIRVEMKIKKEEEQKRQKSVAYLIKKFAGANERSLRSVALEIGIAPGLLDGIVKGNRPIPDRTVEKIIKWVNKQ